MTHSRVVLLNRTYLSFFVGITLLNFCLTVLAPPLFEFPDRLSEAGQSRIFILFVLLLLFSVLMCIGSSIAYVSFRLWKSLLITALCAVMTAALLFAQHLWPSLWDMAYTIAPSRYAPCIMDAESNSGFAVCRDFVEVGGSEHFVAYDRTGEIASPYGDHTDGWIQSVMCQKHFLPPSYVATPLAGHFYRITELGNEGMNFSQERCRRDQTPNLDGRKSK